MEEELKHICKYLKVGYEMYPLYRKVNNMFLFLKGKEEKKNIIVDYTKIDNVDALIKLRNYYKQHHFEEELKEIKFHLDIKLVKLKKYVRYCQTLKDGPLEVKYYPLEVKYYSHILKDIEKLK